MNERDMIDQSHQGSPLAPDDWISPSEELVGRYVVCQQGQVYQFIDTSFRDDNYNRLKKPELLKELIDRDPENEKEIRKLKIDKLIDRLRSIDRERHARNATMTIRCIEDEHQCKVELDSIYQSDCFPRFATELEIAQAKASRNSHVKHVKPETEERSVERYERNQSNGELETSIADRLLEVLEDNKEHDFKQVAIDLDVQKQRVYSSLRTLQRQGFVIVKVQPGIYQLK